MNEKKLLKQLKRIIAVKCEKPKKLDDIYKEFCCPDYLFSLKGYQGFIAEMKFVGKSAKKERKVLNSYVIDSEKPLCDLLREVNQKFNSFVKHEPEYQDYPYIFCVEFNSPLEKAISKTLRKFPNISAVFVLKRADPKKSDYDKKGLLELEKYVRRSSRENPYYYSREKYKWEIYPNPKAKIKFDYSVLKTDRLTR